MKSKYQVYFGFIIYFLIIGCNSLVAQFTIVGNNKGWLPINTTSLGVIPNIVDLQLHMTGNEVYNYPNWSIVGKVTTDVVNSENKKFPVEKMKFRFNSFKVENYYLESTPTIDQIGVIQSDRVMSKSDIYFVNSSNLNPSVPTGRYGRIVLQYDLIIEGGSYLNALASWNNYKIFYEFALLDKGGKVISSWPFWIDMQIQPMVYEDVKSVSISFGASASNVDLNVINTTDYIKGVTKTYEDALIVEANTDYEISVKSMSDKLMESNSNLDISAVNVQLKDTKQLYNKIPLSTTNQKVATGLKLVEPKKYSIIYSTDPSKILIGEAKPGSYKTELLYTISPL